MLQYVIEYRLLHQKSQTASHYSSRKCQRNETIIMVNKSIMDSRTIRSGCGALNCTLCLRINSPITLPLC